VNKKKQKNFDLLEALALPLPQPRFSKSFLPLPAEGFFFQKSGAFFLSCNFNWALSMAIVSWCHRFVFLKTHKTAGTSMEVHLARQCAAGDIVTPIFPAHREHQPRNYRDSEGTQRYFNHMTALEVRALLPAEFGEFYKFCFERHPVDKCLSYFAMLRNSPLHQKPGNPETWEEYLTRGEFPVDTERYTDEAGALLVDRIFKYEEIEQALAEISGATSVEHRPLLVREKAGYRYDVPSFESVMASPAQRGLIFDAFASTLRFVDYS